MSWQQFLAEGEKAVKIVRSGLIKRNIKAGEPILTEFNTDEDIPVYDDKDNKLFWISVKSVSGRISDPIKQIKVKLAPWVKFTISIPLTVFPMTKLSVNLM